MRTIAVIVEGHGETEAVPILVRRIALEVSPASVVHVPRPIRVKRQRIVKPGELEGAVELAAERAGANGGILILLDANGDCPAKLASRLLQRATRARGDRAIRVVLAKREYEAWFLAAAASIAGRHDIDGSTAPPHDPEAVRDAKQWLTGKMHRGRSYRPTIHQPALTSTFDLDSARKNAPSFDKMWRDVESLLRGGAAVAGSRRRRGRGR